MSVLLLRLAGPLQAWGASSRFTHRHTETAPTKSGVLGLLAAARGMRRTDPLTELLDLTFGVRTDQPGRLVRDFQVARSLDGTASMPLTYRYYLADAVFLAAIGGDPALLGGLHEALKRPHFPLYLGRRSCPPAGPISLGVQPGDVATALTRWPWQASPWYQSQAARLLYLPIARDTLPGEPITTSIRDQPLTFDTANRQHAWRPVTRTHLEVTNQHSRSGTAHDPMALLGG